MFEMAFNVLGFVKYLTLFDRGQSRRVFGLSLKQHTICLTVGISPLNYPWGG